MRPQEPEKLTSFWFCSPRNSRKGGCSSSSFDSIYTLCEALQRRLMLIDLPSSQPGVSRRRQASLPFSFPFLPSSSLSHNLKLAALGFRRGSQGSSVYSPLPSLPQPAALNFLSLGSRFSNSEFIFKWRALFPFF